MSTNILSILYIAIIVTIGFFITSKLAKEKKTNLIYFVYLEHLIFVYIYYLYAGTHSADANMYYNVGVYNQGFSIQFGTGTDFILYLSTYLIKLGFNKLALFYLFGFFGYIGFVFFIKMIKIPSSLTLFGISVSTIFLLLPEFHFWTSALGKDSLIFMALMMFFWSYRYLPKTIIINLVSFLIIFLIRPHIGFLLMLSIILSMLFKNPAKYKISDFALIGLSIIILIISFPYLKTFLEVDELGLEEINNKLTSFTNYGSIHTDELSSYVDVSSYSLPMKMFAYFFRPLFFDAHSILQLLASFENFILLLIIFKWYKSINFNLFKWYKSINKYNKTEFIFVLISWVILSMGMYNLGLASRQKYMLLPILFALIINYNNPKYKKLTTKKNIFQ